MGDVIGDLNAKRGRIESMEDLPGGVKKSPPLYHLGEMFGYTTNLRSTTKGRKLQHGTRPLRRMFQQRGSRNHC